MSSEKEDKVMQPKVNKQTKRRGDLLRLRLPARAERTPRRQDLGDLRLQFLLEASSLLR
jgi:hypothetical protein